MNKPGCTAWMKTDRFVFNGEYYDLSTLPATGIQTLRLHVEDVISDINAQIEYANLCEDKVRYDKDWYWKSNEALRINTRILARINHKLEVRN